MSDKQLTAPERKDLRQLEKVIETGMQTFLQVGTALMQIRDNKLYRESSDTFEGYVKKKWDRGRHWAYQLIDAVEVKRSLGMSAIADKIKNESQLRELGKVPDEHRSQVLEAVAETVGDEPITASVIKKTAAEFFADEEPAAEPQADYSPEQHSQEDDTPDWRQIKKATKQYAEYAQRGIDDLNRVRPHQSHDKAVELCSELIRLVGAW